MTSERDLWVRDFYQHPLTQAVLTQGEATTRIADRLWKWLELTPGALVFDQCCGDGSLSLELARRGTRGYGVDISQPFISAAAAAAREQALSVAFSAADASAWSTQEACDAGFNWGTGFGCFLEDSQNQAMLNAAASSLRSGALFLLDYYNVAGVLAGFKPEFSYTRQRDGRQVQITRTSELDLRRGALHQIWRLQETDGAPTELPRTTTRLYLPRELCRMLEDAGFAPLRLFGSAEGEALSLASPRCLVLARRA
ncbi:MAG: class I SAM-dependent methyltransferase [Polyangiaceae bacterium]|nr:class I SAM-dependent methyltransferase [Polyangiaceae bacterium]